MTKPKPRKQRTNVGKGKYKEKQPKVLFKRPGIYGEEDDPNRPEVTSPNEGVVVLRGLNQGQIDTLSNTIKAEGRLGPDLLLSLLTQTQPAYVLEKDGEQVTFQPSPDEGTVLVTTVGRSHRNEEELMPEEARQRWVRLRGEGYQVW